MSAVVGPYWAYSNASLTMLQWQKFYIGGITDPNSFMKQLHQLLPFPELIADLRPSPPIGYSLYVTTPYGWGVHQAMQLSIALASMGPTISQRLLGTHSFHLPVELGPGVFRITKWVEGGEIITKFEGDLDRSKIIGESHVLSPPAQAFAAPQTLPLPPTPQGYISSAASEYPSPQTFNPALDQQRPHSFPTTEAPNPPQGSNPGQGYTPAQGYNTGPGYNPGPGYNTPQGYNLSQGYGPPQSQSPARVHSPAQGYNPSQGYPPAQGYSSPRPYTPSQPYNAPQQPHGYAPPQTYTPSQGYSRYNAPLPYLPGRAFSPGLGGSAPPSPLVRDMRPAVAHWLQHI